MSAERLVEILSGELEKRVPDALATAIEREFGGEDKGELTQAAAKILADYSRKHGATGVRRVTHQLLDLVTGDDPDAAQRLYASGVDMTPIVDKMQGAEAAERKQTETMLATAAQALHDVAGIAARVIVASL